MGTGASEGEGDAVKGLKVAAASAVWRGVGGGPADLSGG